MLLLGDVSDKGAGAALMMARTHSMFRGLAGRPDAVELFAEPAKAMNVVNTALAVGNESCMFVTFLLGTLDLRRAQLSYVRAGHVPPFQRDGGGAIARLTTAAVRRSALRLGFAYRQDTPRSCTGRPPADRH